MRKYGSIKFDAKTKQWCITTEAHVAMRIKRVFGKMDERQFKVLKISATTENSRDLQWFLERYPMDVDPESMLAMLAQQHLDAETTVEKLLAGITEPVSFDLKEPARDYQMIAAAMLTAVSGYLLGDDVGVGKTLSGILCALTPGRLPALVVTLTHLPPQWKRQVERFTGLSIHILKSGKPYDITKYHGGKFPDIIISNYAKLRGWAETLCGLIRYICFDEVHELRHPDSAKYAAAKTLADSVEFKIGLSATGIFNYGGEIFNIMEILRPGALGTREEFIREWCKKGPGGKYLLKDPVAFGLYLREAGLMLRRTRADVKREIPPVTIVPHIFEIDGDVMDHMSGDSVGLARQLLTMENEEYRGQRMQASGEFDVMLRQATGVAKAKYVAEFVKMLHEESGEKIVLFGWHRAVYDIWMKELKYLNPVLYTGSESTAQKEASRIAFVEGDSDLMIISNRSGAGLDGLQDVCHIGVSGELDYSSSTQIQNLGRIHRDGQEEPCIMYYLIADSGSDPVISDILGVKRQQLAGINDPIPLEGGVEATVDVGYIKRLAKDFLLRRGEKLPEAVQEEIPEAA